MRLWKAVTLTRGTKAYWMLGAMVITIITARTLEPQGRGVISATTSWGWLFVAYDHFSFASLIVYWLRGRLVCARVSGGPGGVGRAISEPPGPPDPSLTLGV